MFGCKICNDGNSSLIDNALLTGEAMRTVATRYAVTYNTLRKHRINCLGPRMRKALKLYEQSHVADLVDEVTKMKEEALQILKEGRAAGNANISLLAIDRVIRILELLMKQTQPKETNIYVQTVESKIVLILNDFPEARKKVLEVLYDEDRVIDGS